MTKNIQIVIKENLPTNWLVTIIKNKTNMVSLYYLRIISSQMNNK